MVGRPRLDTATGQGYAIVDVQARQSPTPGAFMTSNQTVREIAGEGYKYGWTTDVEE